jgi:hypothetical protein
MHEMKIIKCEQSSVDWMIARAGVVTASEMDALVSPLWKIRTGDGVQTYLAQKLAEQWIGGPLPSVQGVFDMDNGKILEEEAKPFYTLTTGDEIQSVGFITSDDGKIGASPDGLIGDTSGIEIKCPKMETHIGYLLAGELPKHYAAQVHFSMFVTGRKTWKFMSYRRNFPPLILTVERDDKIMATIAEALELFFENLDAAMAKLVKLNGGLPNQKHRGIKPLPTKDDGRVDFNN